MEIRSHVCKQKLSNIGIDQTFEYSAVAKDDFPVSKHSEDSRLFKSEVESGLFDNIVVSDSSAPHVKYKKVGNET